MDFVWFSGTSLFVTKLLYIRVCRLPSIDAEGLLWIGELISHKFIQWFCEESCYLLPLWNYKTSPNLAGFFYLRFYTFS